MQNKNTPTEGQNSTKLEAESALRDAACSPSVFDVERVTVKREIIPVKAAALLQPRLVRQSSPRIFSGDTSVDMWDEINSAKNVKELRIALYTVCCRMQELESKVESLSLPNTESIHPETKP